MGGATDLIGSPPVRPTVELAAFHTAEGASEVADLLEANGIQSSVESTQHGSALPNMGSYAAAFRDAGYDWRLFVAEEDETRARDAVQGMFASKWFLRAPDGHPYHSFEAATVEVLRAHVAAQREDDRSSEFGRLGAGYLADAMQRQRWHTVWQAFHEGHIHHRHRLLDGLTLDDWARRCGCAHLQHAEET